MKKICPFVLIVALFNQGCCSIFTSGPQVVSIESKPPGAKVKIGNHKGTTPYQVSLARGKDYVVVVEYEGQSQTVALNKSIEPIYWVNILVWPGLLIDLATGKMFKYQPTEYEFEFQAPG
jgi:hypothetical protein